jgi:hypothetical protein
MRITEEQDRRRREAETRERLPRALEDLHRSLAGCIERYRHAFGAESAEIHPRGSYIEIAVRDDEEGGGHERARVKVALAPELPGFQVEGNQEPLVIEVGLLPGNKVYYRAGDQYLTMEELTRRILDRALFPKLKAEG